ncbi:MAG: glycosyltransferase family 4 protein, partial [Myxococcales bacterium]|nr:glycosyltransferase family 4 protein [Myxococcales bacterium]
MTGPRIRILGTAFATVPSSRPHGSSMRSMIDALRGELDLVTLKTEDLPHIKRIGEARMFRVPIGRSEPEDRRAIYARAVARQIEAEPYDVVHVLDPWAGQEAAARKASRGFTLLYEMTTFPEGDSLSWLEAHERTAAAADRILVATEASKKTLEKSRALEGRVDVVRPGVDVGGYDWGGVGPFRVPRLLYLGAFTPSRDVETVLDALARVSRHRAVKALFAGEHGPDRRSELRMEIERRGLAEIVEVRGEPTATKIPAIVAAADVCLAPSAGLRAAGCTELPQPLLEYLACYRPVVAADVPGVSELVRDEVEGLLYPPGSPSALADAILEVLRDATLRERITDAGYRRVRDELNSGARRRRIREIYETVAPGSQRHDPWEEEFEE